MNGYQNSISIQFSLSDRDSMWFVAHSPFEFLHETFGPDSRLHNNLFIDRCKRNVRRVTSNPSSALKKTNGTPYRKVGPFSSILWRLVDRYNKTWAMGGKPKDGVKTNPTTLPPVRGQTFHFFVLWPENRCELFPININCCCI